jgi:hypothetical protein
LAADICCQNKSAQQQAVIKRRRSFALVDGYKRFNE